MFEIWSSGFQDVTVHDGNQFVELNAKEEATLHKESTGIKRDAELEFSFAHRGRNGDDTLKLTITDLGPDNTEGKFLDSAEFGVGVVTARRAK